MIRKLLQLLIIIFFIGFIISCKDKVVDNPIPNQPPETGLFLYPDNGISSQPSKINIHWWGDDPDGLLAGFFFSFDGKNWKFTSTNDSLFALRIGANDTLYTFYVSAADNNGNGIYDSQINQNGINYGQEPFTDLDGNNEYNNEEPFIDIGLIDPTPAKQEFPVKNSAPTLFWNELSILPDTSFPVMSFGWEAEDIDGNETIETINICLNDTSNPANIISLNGGVRRITLRTNDFNSSNPLMEIMIDGLESNIHSQKLPGLRLNDNNILFVQAVDISGAKSKYISLPDSNDSWYVKKPKGNILIVDDYRAFGSPQSFYISMLDSLGLTGKFDIYDFHKQVPPYISVTFPQTIKLFDYLVWFSDNNPSLDLAALSTNEYLNGGGKIIYSLQFSQAVDLTLIQSFLPISADSSSFRISLLGGTEISADNTDPNYPDLELSSGIFRVRAFYLNKLEAEPVYYFPNKELDGFIGFTNNDKSLFFIGVPLSKSNGGEGNVKALLNKIFFEDFGLIK